MIKVAHRGAMGYEPENTLASFKKAIEVGADMLELDTHLCKSGEVIVMHDYTVDRMTNGAGKIEEKTLTELKGLMVGKKERIPTLEEVLDIADRKIKINIELKGRGTATPVAKLLERYVEEKGWNYDDFMVSSFHRTELEAFKKIVPEIKIGVLSDMLPPIKFLWFAKRINAYSVNVPIDKIDQKFVIKMHLFGMKVFAYAANGTTEITKAKEINVDYICSDFPDKI